MKRTFSLFIGLLVAIFCFVGNTNANDIPKDLYDLVVGIDVDSHNEINAVSAYVFEINTTSEKAGKSYLIIVVQNNEIQAIILASDLSPPRKGANDGKYKSARISTESIVMQTHLSEKTGANLFRNTKWPSHKSNG